MNTNEYKKLIEEKKYKEKIFGMLSVIDENVKKRVVNLKTITNTSTENTQVDNMDVLKSILKKIKSLNNQDLVRALSKISSQKTKVDLSRTEDLLRGIKTEVSSVKYPEHKPDEKVRGLLKDIQKSIGSIKLDIPETTKVDKKQIKKIVSAIDGVEESIKKINISVSGGGGGGSFDTTGLATETKQDDLIAEVKKFATNEIYENNNNTYFCKESRNGDWMIMNIDENSVFVYATIKNNAGVSNYQSARSQVTTLTYGTYNEAI